jgi:hypothetical protein
MCICSFCDVYFSQNEAHIDYEYEEMAEWKEICGWPVR